MQNETLSAVLKKILIFAVFPAYFFSYQEHTPQKPLRLWYLIAFKITYSTG
jgi:hypothetical protein